MMRLALIVGAVFTAISLSVVAQQVNSLDRLNPAPTLDSTERYMVQVGPFNGGETMRATGAQIATMVSRFGGFVRGTAGAVVGDVATYGDTSGLNLVDTSPNALAVTPSAGTLGTRTLAALFGSILDPNNYNNVKTTGSVTAASLAVTTPVPASSGGNGTTSLGPEFANDNNVLRLDASILRPGGRLTLITGQPVLLSDVTSASTIVYTCYVGNRVPIYDGVADVFVSIPGCETTFVMAAANVLANSLYDVFAVNVAGVVALGVGPAWTSLTARGTGAGTTQIHNTRGYWTNQVTLNHLWGGAGGVTDLGPVAADKATYLGSVYAVSNGATSMQFRPAAAAGGSNNILGLYNAYNRVMVRSSEQDSTLGYTYSTINTWREANNSAANRISIVDGLQQSVIFVTYNSIVAQSVGGDGVFIGAALDIFNSGPRTLSGHTTTGSVGVSVSDTFMPQLGAHAVAPIEDVTTGGTATFNLFGTFNFVVSMEM